LLKTALLGLFLVSLFACQQRDLSQAGGNDSFAKYGQEFKGKIAETYEESEEWWPSTPKPPAGTPNVVIVSCQPVMDRVKI
jgi:hypothetical protein